MSKRVLVRACTLAVLAAFAVNAVPRAQAETAKSIHLQIALYELREAKEDVRKLTGVPEKYQTKMLGVIDGTITTLKKAIEETGEKVAYIPPDKDGRKDLKNWKLLRHAIKELKSSKEKLKNTTVISETTRVKVLKEMTNCIEVLDKALDYQK